MSHVTLVPEAICRVFCGLKTCEGGGKLVTTPNFLLFSSHHFLIYTCVYIIFPPLQQNTSKQRKKETQTEKYRQRKRHKHKQRERMLCYCQQRTVVRTSWTDHNSGRRFQGREVWIYYCFFNFHIFFHCLIYFFTL